MNHVSPSFMFSKLSIGILGVSIGGSFLEMYQILSGYLPLGLSLIGIFIGLIGMLKEKSGKLGVLLNSGFFIFLILMLYLPPFLLGD